jgi:hypothetical protein
LHDGRGAGGEPDSGADELGIQPAALEPGAGVPHGLGGASEVGGVISRIIMYLNEDLLLVVADFVSSPMR